MADDALVERLFGEISSWLIVDTHSHIDPRNAASKSLEEIVGYHYFTELVHSCGLSHDEFGTSTDARSRCKAVIGRFDRLANTVQANWLREIARTFAGFDSGQLSAQDSDSLFDHFAAAAANPGWERSVIRRTKLQQVFLTNAFDDPLTGFDRSIYVPCLRTDDLVFDSHSPAVRRRLEQTTGVEVHNLKTIRNALGVIFERFRHSGARAVAVSLPPDFHPVASVGKSPDDDAELDRAASRVLSVKVFWMIAESCRDFELPFDLMIGVNRGVYRGGVPQGQDLFDGRTSLIQYAELFNAFPGVRFPVSVLSSGQNQELVAHSWLFPNVFPHGHWWYSNIPAYIEPDLRARMTAVPISKLLGYYSDAYKLEFVLPKFNMYRRCLARVLADEFVRPGLFSEGESIRFARALLIDNVAAVFG